MTDKKNPRGAGRPPGAKSDMKINPMLRRDHYNTRLPQYIIEWLRGQTESVGKIITEALVEKYGIPEPEIPKKVKIDEKNWLTTEKVVRDNKKGVTE